MAEIATNINTIVTAHGARQRLDRVGRTQQFAVWSVDSVGSGCRLSGGGGDGSDGGDGGGGGDGGDGGGGGQRASVRA